MSCHVVRLCNSSLLFTKGNVALALIGAKRHGSFSTKHWDPKWRKVRQTKLSEVDLPDFDEHRKEMGMSPEEIRSKMKEKGIVPPRPWTERPVCISCTGDIFEAYVPPEGDGKISPVTVVGAKQRLEWLQKKGKSMMALRKIRNFDEEFEVADFAAKAQDIYVEAHRLLAEKDEDKLHELVTEACFPEMMRNVNRKTVRWNFVSSLEIPRVVHIRCTSVISKENMFAQITVRVHSKQTLAVYDRFGRLMHGSETAPKDVLEYVVFEKHLPNQYSLWRIHGKIIPDWMPPKEPPPRTFRESQMPEPPPAPVSETQDDDETIGNKPSPPLATA